MKIVFSHITSGLVHRGSEVSTHTLANYLAKKGHQVWLYQMGTINKKAEYKTKKIRFLLKPKYKKDLTIFGKILQRLYLDYNSLIVLFFSLKTVPDLLKLKPNILIPTNGFWQIIICKFVSMFTKSKIAIIGRAGIGWTDKNNIKLKPDLFIGLSTKAESWAKKMSPGIKSIFLPNPINIKSFVNQTKKVKLEAKRPIVLCVAALTPYKNIDKLIQAVSKIPNVSLVIAGRGELYSKLMVLGKKLLGNRFEIINCNYSYMNSLYKAGDVFVLLSDEKEAFGRVFLEAMTCGLPIVTIDLPQRKDIVGKNGFYVNSLDIQLIGEAIKKALKSKIASQMKKQADKFDISKIGPKYEEALLKLENQ
ncbi:glycosyltransferase family 4 protein [Patescibacteria group bacterium]